MIFVTAYCVRNLGDDMFVRTLVRRYPQTQFHLHAQPSFTGHLAEEPNLSVDGRGRDAVYRLADKVSSRLANRYLNRQMARADAVVRIGGSIFIEGPESDKRFFIENNDNVFIIGANFGPYQSQRYLETRKQRIRHARDCCFRDRASCELFRDVPTVRYAPDILFGYPYYPTYQQGSGVGVSVIDFSRRRGLAAHQAAYEAGMAAVCDRHIAAGRTVTLFAFCTAEGDRAAAERIAASCRDRSAVNIVNYDGDIDPFLEALNRCELLYATRFHAMAIGFAMQKKVIPVIYSQKQSHVLEDIGFHGAVWDVCREQTPDNRVLSADTAALDPMLIQQLYSDAQAQFHALDRFLGTAEE